MLGICEMPLAKEAHKATNYNDALGDHDKIWGGNKLLYYMDNNIIMHWNIKVLNVGLVNHERGGHGEWMYMTSDVLWFR